MAMNKVGYKDVVFMVLFIIFIVAITIKADIYRLNACYINTGQESGQVNKTKY